MKELLILLKKQLRAERAEQLSCKTDKCAGFSGRNPQEILSLSAHVALNILKKTFLQRGQLLFLLTLLILCASCASPETSTDIPSPTEREQSPSILLLTPIATQINYDEVIVLETLACIDKYNYLVAREMQTKDYEVVTLPDGVQGINFVGNVREKITDAFFEMQECVRKQNLEYTKLYKINHDIPPLPDTQLAQQSRLAELKASLNGWLEEERKKGNVVEVYSPLEMRQTILLFGDSYAKSAMIEEELKNLELALAGISNDLIQIDAKIIGKIDNGDVSLLGVFAIPYYRADIKLTSYQTETYYYTIYSNQHSIIEIVPKRIPLTSDLTPISPLSISELEQKARNFIEFISPDTEIDTLTAIPGSKKESYFFRWEDRTKPLLDDGRSYPFVQIGYNLDGELLNFYNTLPLSR